jgi:uncharacterized protein YkwD
MSKKLFIVTVLITLALSACNGGGAAEPTIPAVTDTPPATAVVATTQAVTLTETFTLTPDGTAVTTTPTLGTVQPTNPPDCTNSASFVTDITIPDNTNVAAGTVFTKTWRIANNGTCVWGPGYTLTHYSDERMGAPDSVLLGITHPGENLDISVDLTAPNSSGRHQANFVIKNPAGLIIKVGDDSRLWVVINVTVGGAAGSIATITSTSAAATSAPATLAPATAAGAAPATATGAVPAATVGGSGPGNASCLFTIDRTKLMEVINAVNAYRTEKGLSTLYVNPKLAQAAQRHAADMACNSLTAHDGSDRSTPQSRVAATGYVASSVSENVYSSSPPFTGEGAVNSWVTDTADTNNNRNLLSTTFTQIGVGYAQFGNSGSYVIVFAAP